MREARPAGRWTHGWNEGTSEWRGPRGFVSSVGGESSREVFLFNKLSAQHHGGRQLHKYPCVFPFVWAAALCVFLQIWFFRLSFFHCNCLLHPLSHVLCLLVCCRFSQSVYFTVLFLPRLSEKFFPSLFCRFLSLHNSGSLFRWSACLDHCCCCVWTQTSSFCSCCCI